MLMRRLSYADSESVAFQIHNAYNGIEELLRLIAAHFEISD